MNISSVRPTPVNIPNVQSRPVAKDPDGGRGGPDGDADDAGKVQAQVQAKAPNLGKVVDVSV